MRILSLIFAVLLLLSSSASAQDRTRTLSKVFELNADATVEVITYKGLVSVVAWDEPQVAVEIEFVAEDLDGIIMLPHMDVEIRSDEKGLRMETDYRKALRELQRLFQNAGAQRLPLVNYTVKMPRTATLKVDDHMSTIRVTDLQSVMDIFTYKGVIELNNVGGSLKIDTFSGKARIALHNLTRDSSFDTHEGSIAIRLPRDAGFDLNVDMAEAGAMFAADSTLSSLGRVRDNYHGIVNGGGPLLSLVTHRGSFMLSTE